MLKPLKLIFMGTPLFALPALDLIHASHHRLLALVTVPDQPRGRGQKIKYNPTKEWASKHGIPVAQPGNISESSFVDWLNAMSADLIVTVAYGKLLPEQILKLPTLGCINLHASYLPYYRGAAPIHRAVIDGAEHSGVSVITMSPELDAGDIILQEKVDILMTDTAGSLHDRLAERGAALLIKSLDLLAAGKAIKTPQTNELATYAPALKPDDERLDWSLSPLELYNRIRGLNPWPVAHTILNSKRLKIWCAARPDDYMHSNIFQQPGTVVKTTAETITVATGEGVINLLEVQPAGKKIMDAASYCRGYKIKPGDIFNGEKLR